MDLGREVDKLHRHVSRAGLEGAGFQTMAVDPLLDSLRRAKKRFKGNTHKTREPLFFLLWVVWLFAGTMFYAFAPKSALGLVKGFYMAINIGYSIGFGYPSEEGQSDYLWFSSIYVLLGASFVGVALGFFAEKISADSETWFSKLQHEKEMSKAIKSKNTTYQGHLQAWIYHNSSALKAVSSWLTIVITMITYSMIQVGWPFVEAQYFAISTLSTGGHWPIPKESPLWLYGVTAVFTCVGVPIMAVAMAEIAQVLIAQPDLDEAKETIDAVVTKEELELLLELGLEDFDGKVDKAEFIILCMVRMGTDPGLITYITQRFAELNFYTGEALTVAEITQGACKFVKGRIRRAESVQAIQASKLKIVSEHDYVVPEASKSYLDYFHTDGSASSHGDSDPDLGQSHQRRRRAPALAAVPEDLTQSEHVRQIEQQHKDVTPNKAEMEIPTPSEIDGSSQSYVDSSCSAPIHRSRSLELNEVFNPSMNSQTLNKSGFASGNASGYSSASTATGSRRIPRNARRDTSRPLPGQNLLESLPGLSTMDENRVASNVDSDSGIPSVGLNQPKGYAPNRFERMENMESEQSADMDSSIGSSSGYSFAACSRRILSTGMNASKRQPPQMADLAEESDDADLIAIEEGALIDEGSTPSQHKGILNGDVNEKVCEGEEGNANGLTHRDAFLDEMEEGRLDNTKPNRLQRFYDELEQECSAPFEKHTAQPSNSNENKQLDPSKLNYADFLFSRATGSRELEARQAEAGPPHEQGSRGSQGRRSTRPTRNEDQSTQFLLHSNGSDLSSDTESRPRLPKKSFSSYLVHAYGQGDR